ADRPSREGLDYPCSGPVAADGDSPTVSGRKFDGDRGWARKLGSPLGRARHLAAGELPSAGARSTRQEAGRNRTLRHPSQEWHAMAVKLTRLPVVLLLAATTVVVAVLALDDRGREMLTAREVLVLEGQPGQFEATFAAFSPDGTRLAVGGHGHARVWDLA